MPETRVPVSVVIPTLNEAARIGSALAALSWADEVLVVDGGSSDATARLARKGGARVLELRGQSIGAQRNAGVSQARNEWVLALDADEVLSAELIVQVAAVTHFDGRLTASLESSDAFEVRFREHLYGRELTFGTFGTHYKSRLFRRHYRFTEVRTHERLEPVRRTGRLSGTILHFSCRGLDDQLAKMMRYSAWQGADLFDLGRRAGVRDILFRPMWRFFKEYALYGGWRAGKFGLVQTLVAAMSTFAKYAFLWERALLADDAARARAEHAVPATPNAVPEGVPVPVVAIGRGHPGFDAAVQGQVDAA